MTTDFTPNSNLYKAKQTDELLTTITELGNNAQKIDAKFVSVESQLGEKAKQSDLVNISNFNAITSLNYKTNVLNKIVGVDDGTISLGQENSIVEILPNDGKLFDTKVLKKMIRLTTDSTWSNANLIFPSMSYADGKNVVFGAWFNKSDILLNNDNLQFAAFMQGATSEIIWSNITHYSELKVGYSSENIKVLAEYNGYIYITGEFNDIPINNYGGFIFYVIVKKGDQNAKKLDIVNPTILQDTLINPSRIYDKLENYWQDKKVNFLGDSFTAMDVYTKVLCKDLGLSYNNYGVGSSRITEVTAGDDSFVNRCSSMDTTADLNIILGGTNDTFADIPIGTITDTIKTTFYGALKNMFDTIFVNHPKARVIFITPTMTWKGELLFPYVDAILEVCKLYSVPCLNLAYESGLNMKNLVALTRDQIHPTDAFYTVIGQQAAKFVSQYTKLIED